MKTLFIFILLSAIVVMLSGCANYGMGRHHMNARHYDQNRAGSHYMQGNALRSSGPYMR
jgi:hypothetical protein